MKIHRPRVLMCGMVAALAVFGAVVLAGPAASAAPTILPTETEGTLYVHKHETPASALPGNGLELGVLPGSPPVPGIVFTATKLNFDLRTNAGWADLSGMDIEDVADHVDGAAELLDPTDSSGTASITLPVGAYYVEEVVFGPAVTPVAPFIVTIPMTHPINLDEWLYEVHVYPKNDIMDPPVKTVSDAGVYQLGQNVVFGISTEIPDVVAEQTLDGYRVRDVLANQLSHVSTVVALSSGAPALVLGTHYTATLTGREVLVTFTGAGLTLLQANSSQEVVTTVTARVDEVGEISNQATLFPSDTSWNSGTGTGVPSNFIETHWGAITVVKHRTGDRAERLVGAEFKIYPTESDALADTNAISLPTNPNSDKAVWITDLLGQVRIEGLRYSDFTGGAQVPDTDPGYRAYWIVETKSPIGFELLSAPLRVVLDGETVNVEVANVPQGGGFDLPFTGGSGLWLFPIGGALLIGGATLLLVSRRRRLQPQV